MKHSLSFSPRFVYVNVTQPYGLVNQMLCYINMLLNIEKKSVEQD